MIVNSLRPSAYLCVLCDTFFFNAEDGRDTQRGHREKALRDPKGLDCQSTTNP